MYLRTGTTAWLGVGIATRAKQTVKFKPGRLLRQGLECSPRISENTSISQCLRQCQNVLTFTLEPVFGQLSKDRTLANN